MKRKQVLAAALLTAMTAGLFAGSAVAEENKAYEFTFICPLVGLEYWDMCADGIRAADEEFGTSTQIVGTSDASMIVSAMATNMETAIASHPDGIMAYCGLDIMPPLIKTSMEAGVPVLALDSDAPDSERIAYVGTNPYNAGYASGEALLDASEGKPMKVAVIMSSIAAEKEMLEIEAFKDAVADADVEIIATEESNADLVTGVTKMEALVQTYPEMTAVLGTSAYDVQAAAKVKEEMGLDDLVLIGYDDQEETLNYIRKGVINGIIVQDPYMMGYLGVKTMKEYLDNDHKLENTEIDTGTITVTAENVDNYR